MAVVDVAGLLRMYVRYIFCPCLWAQLELVADISKEGGIWVKDCRMDVWNGWMG